MTTVINGSELRKLRTAGVDLPKPEPEPAFVAARRERCGMGKATTYHCDELEDGRYCEVAIDTDCKKCQLGRRMQKFLREPDSRCPLGHWGPHTEK